MKKNFKAEVLRIKNDLIRELDSGEWKEERKTRSGRFRSLLSKKRIERLSEGELGEIIKNLWASRMWSDKDWLVSSILQRNGIELIRYALKDLLYGGDDLKSRFNQFSSKISGFGPSSITEILVFFDSQKYCLWNNKPKEVIPKLDQHHSLPIRVFKYQITGQDYELIQEFMTGLLKEMRGLGFPKADFLDLDIIMWMLFQDYQKAEPKDEGEKLERGEFDEEKFIHEDAEALLIKLGNILGYATYTPDSSKYSDYLKTNLGDLSTLSEIPSFTFERHLDTVRHIDVIWFREDFPFYCFEIEHTTGVSAGLLRLYQIRNFTNAKFFIIAPSRVMTKYMREISKDPFHQIKSRYQFRSYSDLKKVYDAAVAYDSKRVEFFGNEKSS